jgi:hypothetical protein
MSHLTQAAVSAHAANQNQRMATATEKRFKIVREIVHVNKTPEEIRPMASRC